MHALTTHPHRTHTSRTHAQRTHNARRPSQTRTQGTQDQNLNDCSQPQQLEVRECVHCANLVSSNDVGARFWCVCVRECARAHTHNGGFSLALFRSRLDAHSHAEYQNIVVKQIMTLTSMCAPPRTRAVRQFKPTLHFETTKQPAFAAQIASNRSWRWMVIWRSQVNQG